MQGTTEVRVGLFVFIAIAIFVYMGFQIGAFRLDRAQYNAYVMYFSDISGLARKADVRIAGVKVGWVESVSLTPDNGMQAEVEVMVSKDYSLYNDAYAIVRQDGLLGPKFIEVIPGDPLLHPIAPGDALHKPSVEPVSVDQLLMQFKHIATNVQDVTESFQKALGGTEGQDQLKGLVNNLSDVVQRVSTVSDIVERAFVRNEGSIDTFIGIGDNVNRIADKLEIDVLPSFQESIEKISYVFDRDFDRIATQLSSTAESIEDASVQAREGLRNLNSVAEKIDEGKGLLGKLVNEDETYQDLRVAVRGFKNYLTKVDRMEIVFDSHVETMHRPAENLSFADTFRRFEDSKGYVDVRIHPNENHFYILQLVSSVRGSYEREEKITVFRDRDKDNCIIDPRTAFEGQNNGFIELDDVFDKQRIRIKRNTIKLGLQFGKIFDTTALRFGLFEGSAGIGVDFDIPFKSDKIRWVTSLEAFDFIGWNRIDDRRPHIKWINKMFLFNNIYMTFGADDIASKNNASVFMGTGIRFGDEDIKYLLPSFSGLGSSLQG